MPAVADDIDSGHTARIGREDGRRLAGRTAPEEERAGGRAAAGAEVAERQRHGRLVRVARGSIHAHHRRAFANGIPDLEFRRTIDEIGHNATPRRQAGALGVGLPAGSGVGRVIEIGLDAVILAVAVEIVGDADLRTVGRLGAGVYRQLEAGDGVVEGAAEAADLINKRLHRVVDAADRRGFHDIDDRCTIAAQREVDERQAVTKRGPQAAAGILPVRGDRPVSVVRHRDACSA